MVGVMHILRTADEHFVDLPEFPYTARYCGHPDQHGGASRVDAGEELAKAIVRFLAG
jgi:hypothetical protein